MSVIVGFKPKGEVSASPKPSVLVGQLSWTLQVMEEYLDILEACTNPGALCSVVGTVAP